MLAHRGSEVGDNLKDGDIGVYASELDIRSRLEYSWIQAPGAMGALRNLQPLTLAPHNMKKQLESESVENQGFSLRAYIVCAHHLHVQAEASLMGEARIILSASTGYDRDREVRYP